MKVQHDFRHGRGGSSDKERHGYMYAGQRYDSPNGKVDKMNMKEEDRRGR